MVTVYVILKYMQGQKTQARLEVVQGVLCRHYEEWYANTLGNYA